jgi:hypothetical protein
MIFWRSVRSSMTRIGVICRKTAMPTGASATAARATQAQRAMVLRAEASKAWRAGGRAKTRGAGRLRAGMHFGTVAAAGARCSSAGDRRRSVQTMAVPRQTAPHAGAARIRPHATHPHPRLRGLVWGGKAVKPAL